MLTRVSFWMLLLVLIFGNYQPNNAATERFSVYRYGSTDKKASSLVKTTIEDSLGTVWFGGDGGLTRHNGYRYTSFTNQLPSQFVKSLHKLHDGTLVCVTDLGICGINTVSADNATISLWIQGATSESNGTVFYPKNLYEDNKGNIWIAEPNTIVRLRRTNGGVSFERRYNLPAKVRTQSFSRSFQFLETSDGNLFSFSETGYFFRYNPQQDDFTEWKINGNIVPGLSGIAAAPPFNEKPLIASSVGLFRIEQFDFTNQQISLSKLQDISGLSSIAIKDSLLILGTWEKGVFIGKPNNLASISELQSPVINDIFFGKSVIWIAADDGVFAIKTPLFIAHSLQNRYYIEALSKQPNGNVIISDGRTLYKIRQQGSESYPPEPLFSIENDLLLSLTSNDTIIYAASRECKIVRLQSNSRPEIITLQKKGNRLLNSIALDTKGWLWACEDKVQGVHRLTPNNQAHFYPTVPASKINCVYKSTTGTIVVGGEFPGLLFTYQPSKDTLLPMTISNRNAVPQNLIVYSLLSAPNTDTLYLGTNLGLWCYTLRTKTLNAVTCSDFGKDNFTVWALHYSENGVIWASTTLGPLAYKNNQATFFTEQDGLRTTAMAQSKIVGGTTSHPLIWLGTASGLHSINAERIFSMQSHKPILSSLTSAGDDISDNEISFGSYFRALYFSILFPNDAVEYRTRIKNTDQWSIPTNSTELMVSSLPEGDYTLEIQVRQRGQLWSQSAEYSFTVSSPWYMQWYVMLPFFSLIALLGYLALSRKEALEARRGAEQEARLRQSYFIAIIDSSEDIIWSLDLDYNFTSFNASAYRYVLERYGVEMKMGTNFFTTIPPAQHELWKIIFQKALDEGTFRSSFKESSREVYYETIITPISSEGKILGVAFNARNVTEAQIREQELENARNEAEAAYKSQAAFLSLMSHEIRTPLNAILGFSHILLQQERTSEERMFIEQIHSNGNYLLEVMNNILDISRLESGYTKVQSQPFSIHEVLDNATRKFKDQCSTKGLFINLTIMDDIENIAIGDSKLIRQVLVQLLDNAIKFTHEGGITLSAKSQRTSQTNKVLYTIDVTDTGVGIASDKLDMIFNSFSQAEDSSTRQFGGAGIGLSICKKIAEILQGSITVASKLHHGSTFSFTFSCEAMEMIPLSTETDIADNLQLAVPLSPSPAQPPSVQVHLQREPLSETIIHEPQSTAVIEIPTVEPQEPNIPEPQLRVLLAEDNPIISRKLLALLNSLHCNTDSADSATKAKELFAQHTYHLCLIDSTLPDSSDAELAAQFTNASPPPTLVRLHMNNEQQSTSALFSASLTKPVDKDKLQEILLTLRSQANF